MSVCLAALVIFAVLGIFSAKYRRWAKEAFGCVARRLTLRPCEAGLNQRIRAKITGKLLRKAPRLARFTHKYFEPISWVFTIVLFVSLIITATSLYNLAIYGTCDPNSDICILSPSSADCGCEAGSPDCTEENNFSACEGDCNCVGETCE